MHTVFSIAIGLLTAQLVDPPTAAAAAGQPTLAGPQAAAAPPASTSIPAEEAAPAEETETEPARLVPVQPSPRGSSPAALVDEALQRPAANALVGTEVSLYDVLAGTVGRAQRAQVIRTYWELSAALANYHFALDAQHGLAQLADQQSATTDAPLVSERLDAALAAARVQVEEMKLAATTAQHRLAELRPGFLPTALPLPTSRPHVGAYRTVYEQIFSGQTVPTAKRLDATLPIQYDLIRARAEAVRTTTALLSATTDAVKAGHCSAAALADCYERLEQRQRRFVAVVRNYNFDIAEYAQLVAPEGLDPAQLVSMLIKTEVRPSALLPADPDGLTSVLQRNPTASAQADGTDPPDVVPATAEEPVDEVNTLPGHAAPSRDQFVPRRPGREL